MNKFDKLYNNIMEEVATFLANDNKLNANTETMSECCDGGISAGVDSGQCFGPATPDTSLSVTTKPDSNSGDARIPCIIGRKNNKKKKEKIRLLNGSNFLINS